MAIGSLPPFANTDVYAGNEGFRGLDSLFSGRICQYRDVNTLSGLRITMRYTGSIPCEKTPQVDRVHRPMPLNPPWQCSMPSVGDSCNL